MHQIYASDMHGLCTDMHGENPPRPARMPVTHNCPQTEPRPAQIPLPGDPVTPTTDTPPVAGSRYVRVWGFLCTWVHSRLHGYAARYERCEMAGHGPAPKPSEKRARRNVDPAPLRVIVAEPAKQPPLPQRGSWPADTRKWWQMWADSPLSQDFISTDWSELAIAALLHAAVVEGDLKYAAELRLRVAKFGVRPGASAGLLVSCAAPPGTGHPGAYSGARRGRPRFHSSMHRETEGDSR